MTQFDFEEQMRVSKHSYRGSPTRCALQCAVLVYIYNIGTEYLYL